MGNISSICVNPDSDKTNTTVFAAVSKRLNINAHEYQTDKSDFVEIPHEEGKNFEADHIQVKNLKPNSLLNLSIHQQHEQHEEQKENNQQETPNQVERSYTRKGSEIKLELAQEKVVDLVESEPKVILEEEKVEKFLALDQQAKTNDEPVIILDKKAFDFETLQAMNNSIELIPFDEIKRVTAQQVLQKEQEFTKLDYSEYQGKIFKKNYELPPCLLKESQGIYHGSWNVDGQMEGRGYLINKDGSKFDGVWKNGDLQWGRLYYSDGSLYQGRFLSFQPYGTGILYAKDKKVYKGRFENGDIVDGTIEYEDTFYKGEILNKLPHGNGEYKSPKYTFIGEWKNGRKLLGKLIYPDGTIYEGQFYENVASYGKFTWLNGVTYEGDLKNFTGTHDGVYDHPSGSYNGQWNFNVFNGKGTYIWKNENLNKYEGDYKQGKKEGKGVYFINSEDFFSGTWKSGKPDGDCEYVRNGRVIKCRWRKGNFLNILGESQKGDESLFNFIILDEINTVSTLTHLPTLENKTENSNKYKFSKFESLK